MPIDAVLTAFFTCLGAMKRIGDVQRGWAPHVPPEALHRGPLWLLFPRGTAALPRISSLLGVALVWGCLWGGLCLGLLSCIYAMNGGTLCLSGWQYIVARACWSTTEAVLVSAGSYLLWCSKADDLESRSLVERASLRRQADEKDARAAAAFFGVYQSVNALAAVALLGLCLLLKSFSVGAVPRIVWVGAIVIGGSSLLVALLGCCLNRYHRRDRVHEAKTMRPGALLGVYVTLLMATCLLAAVLGAVALLTVPASMEYLLQNWSWLKTRALPFSEPLEVAQATANRTSQLAVCAIVLASIQALALVNVCTLLSRRGALALVPFGLHSAALSLAALTVTAGFVYAPVGCLVSPRACAALQATTTCALLLLLLCLARLCCLGPGEGRHHFMVYALYSTTLLIGFSCCAAVGGIEAQAEYDVATHWKQIELVMPSSW